MQRQEIVTEILGRFPEPSPSPFEEFYPPLRLLRQALAEDRTALAELIHQNLTDSDFRAKTDFFRARLEQMHAQFRASAGPAQVVQRFWPRYRALVEQKSS